MATWALPDWRVMACFQGGMVKRQVAAGRQRLHQAADDRICLLVVQHMPQHAEQRDRDRPAKVQGPGCASEDVARIMQVGIPAYRFTRPGI